MDYKTDIDTEKCLFTTPLGLYRPDSDRERGLFTGRQIGKRRSQRSRQSNEF